MEFKNGDKVILELKECIYIGKHPNVSDMSVVLIPGVGFDTAFDGRLQLAPKTMMLCDIEFPEPVREALNDGDEYWLVNTGELCADRYDWGDDKLDCEWLKSGLIQRNKEGAELQLKAMIKSVGGEV